MFVEQSVVGGSVSLGQVSEKGLEEASDNVRSEADLGVGTQLSSLQMDSPASLWLSNPQAALQCPIDSDKPRIMIPAVEPSTIRSGFNIGP